MRNVRQNLQPSTFRVQGKPKTRERSSRLRAQIPTGVPPFMAALPLYSRRGGRLDKAQGNQKRDAELMARVRPAMRALEQLYAHPHSDEQHAEIQRLQWLIEELRVSLFAQDLKTAVPVSEKRIQEQIERAQGATLKSMP